MKKKPLESLGGFFIAITSALLKQVVIRCKGIVYPAAAEPLGAVFGTCSAKRNEKRQKMFRRRMCGKRTRRALLPGEKGLAVVPHQPFMHPVTKYGRLRCGTKPAPPHEIAKVVRHMPGGNDQHVFGTERSDASEL